jgi:hypothetical protein
MARKPKTPPRRGIAQEILDQGPQTPWSRMAQYRKATAKAAPPEPDEQRKWGAEQPAAPGRPPDSTSIDYTVMDRLIGFRLLHPSAFRQATLINLIQYVYAQDGGEPPARSTIMERIKRLKPKPK